MNNTTTYIIVAFMGATGAGLLAASLIPRGPEKLDTAPPSPPSVAASTSPATVTPLTQKPFPSPTLPAPTVQPERKSVPPVNEAATNNRFDQTLTAINQVVSSITGDQILTHIRFLSKEIGPRVAGTPEEKRAADYIENVLRRYGYATRQQRFVARRRTTPSYNVVASLPASGKPKLVVGAHLDSVPGAAGANDNASGVAVILDVARLLAHQQPAYDITFVAFGAEELAHDGSKYYVSHSAPPSGMINLDMVGVGKDFQIGYWGNPDRWLVDHCWNVASRMGYNPQLNPPFTGKSDYASFADAGVPVACYVWDPDDHHHLPTDRLEHLDTGELTRRLEITARSLAAALLTPASFKQVGRA